ncbi:hypothetical protein JOB18_031622 [Solea senegalensis]|uniref:Secreted protein n=1 Tax=Solea senegalensis TaxID=28829 RepID=A0AAV6RLT3_SOLSE|nr:hypothetical protein JOB18_031622 [Solea senegalensis]
MSTLLSTISTISTIMAPLQMPHATLSLSLSFLCVKLHQAAQTYMQQSVLCCCRRQQQRERRNRSAMKRETMQHMTNVSTSSELCKENKILS